MAIDPSSIIDGFAERTDDQGLVALAESLTRGGKDAEASALAAAAAERLSDKSQKIQGGCIKILYEMGYRKPQIIARYAATFVHALKSPNNRLVWGGMIALSTIAELEADFIFQERETMLAAIREGSVITQDRGIMTLGLVAAAKKRYKDALLPVLLGFLRSCRASDAPKFAEHISPAVGADDVAAFRAALEPRLGELAPAARKRAEKIVRGLPASEKA
jgi:hypothetical protein